MASFQEDPKKKTEQVMVMTKSNSFYSNQWDVTLRLIIRSGQFSNPSEISSIIYLSASVRNIPSKLNELW